MIASRADTMIYELGIPPSAPAVLEVASGIPVIHIPDAEGEFRRYRMMPAAPMLDLLAWTVTEIEPDLRTPATPYRVALERDDGRTLRLTCNCDWFTKSRSKGTFCKHTRAAAALWRTIKFLGGHHA